MKTKINIFLISLVAALGGLMTSCDNDDKDGVADAVMGSSRSIEFPAVNPAPIMITIVADGAWHCDAPEWLTVTPNSGPAGTTDVMIEAISNIRLEKEDVPRKYTLKFMGDTKRSMFEVLVRQGGDKFRDIQPSTIAQMAAMEEEAAVEFVNLPVLAQTKNGFVGTDGTDFVYVTGEAAQARAGQLIDMLGIKMDSDTQLPYVICDQLTDAKTGDIPVVAATDITDKIDDYTSDRRTYIKVTGLYDGSKLNIEGKTLGVSVEDCNIDTDVKKFAGHFLTLTGIYSGTASPVLRMIVTEIEDLGANETIYLQSNFDIMWARFADWVNPDKSSNIDAMGTDNDGVYLPNLGTPKVDGVSPLDILNENGWIINGGGNLTGKATGCNFQKFYLKMGSTDKENSATLPKMEGLGDGTTGVHVSFDWCPWRDSAASAGKAYDPTEIVLIVKNGDSETQFPVSSPSPAPGESLRWYNVDIDLGTMSLNKDTRIEIRNCDAQYLPNGAVKGKFRWFLNNIKVYKEKE